MISHLIPRGAACAAIFAAAALLAACASTPDGTGGIGSAATPGSVQQVKVNVGYRVFFESDQTDLTPAAVATLDKQAQWLKQYPRYTFTIEGHADERGTREYNFSLGARR